MNLEFRHVRQIIFRKQNINNLQKVQFTTEAKIRSLALQ